MGREGWVEPRREHSSEHRDDVSRPPTHAKRPSQNSLAFFEAQRSVLEQLVVQQQIFPKLPLQRPPEEHVTAAIPGKLVLLKAYYPLAMLCSVAMTHVGCAPQDQLVERRRL